MPLELIRGAAAEARLAEPAFEQGWHALWQACPWATAFQGPDFVTTWYRVYRGQFEPALVVERQPDGRLLGLLTLAVGRAAGDWRVAGTSQAEYQAWLALPGAGDDFAAAALALLFDPGGARRLEFRYLPAAAPLGWTASARWRRHVRRRSWSRPLMLLDEPAALRRSLAKRGNKSRLKRLGRGGDVRLELVTEPVRLAEVIERFAALCDFRHGAAHGTLPFRDDPLKARFHLALLERPGLLHATLLWAGERLVSAHLGLADRGVLYNGLLTHSPFEARHSPGKLHVLLMAQRLVEDGFACFDLTPGDDPWKERFATASEQVTQLTVYREPWRRLVLQAASTAKAAVSRALDARGIDAAALRRRTVELLRGGVPAWRRLVGPERNRLFALPPERLGPARALELNRLERLIDHAAGRGSGLLPGFLADALERLEQGLDFVSCEAGGRLCFLAWLVGSAEARATTEWHYGFRCPDDTAVLEVRVVEPSGSARDRIAAAAALLGSRSGASRLLVVAPADCGVALRALGGVEIGATRRRLRPRSASATASFDPGAPGG